MTAATGFLNRYGAAFGRPEALMRKLSGLLGGEATAEGAWITDTGGRRWLDFGSFGLHLLGHRHPDVLAAATDQLGRMGLSGKVLGNEAATRLAEALIAATPDRLDRAVLANSGGEAIDMAVKMVLLATGRPELLAFRHSYHGKTVGALSLSDAMRTDATPALGNKVHFVDVGDVDTVRALLTTRRVAGVFIEPVQGEGGIRPVPPAFIADLRALCDETGTPLVFDEIQTGLGRCGTRWRSADTTPPDLLVSAKILGGGLVPLAAVVFAGKVLGAAATDPVVLASSYAGGALAARVGEAVLALVTDDALLARVRAIGTATLDRLRAGLAGDPRIREIRGEGLMIGIDLHDPGVAGYVVVEAAKRGLLVSFCLSQPNVIRVYPPSVVTEAELAEGVDALLAAVAAAPTQS